MMVLDRENLACTGWVIRIVKQCLRDRESLVRIRQVPPRRHSVHAEFRQEQRLRFQSQSQLLYPGPQPNPLHMEVGSTKAKCSTKPQISASAGLVKVSEILHENTT